MSSISLEHKGGRSGGLHLKNWDSICTLKQAGGLGIRRMMDVNIAHVTKLGWKVCTKPTRTWVKLIRSKYLRGRRTVDFQTTSTNSSWIWNGIRRCKVSLDRGLCFKIEEGSFVRICEDIWIPDLPNYKLHEDLLVTIDIQRITDLIQEDRKSWNVELIKVEFSKYISKLILTIPICNGEQDSFV